MENHIKVRKVTQDVLISVWFKHGSFMEEPVRDIYDLIPEISKEFINNLSDSVWIELFRSHFIWYDFFEKHLDRMMSSPKLFANYVAYIFYVLNNCPNAHECFFDILSFVAYVSIGCLENDMKPYLNTCVDLFCAFFEKELRTKFERQGGWEKFNEYLEKQYNLIESKSMISDDESPGKLFKYFQDALERSKRPDIADCGFVYKKRIRPHYVVNGIVIKDITQTQVENHEKASGFAESIKNKMEELVQKTFHEITIEFSKTCNQIKDLYQWKVIGASVGMTRKAKQSFKQRELIKDISNKTKSKEKVFQSKRFATSNPLKTQNLNTIDTEDVVAPVQASHLKPKSTKREIAKKLLGSMSEDVVVPVQASPLKPKSTKREIAESLPGSMAEDVVVPVQASHLKPKSTKREIAEKLHGRMSEDVVTRVQASPLKPKSTKREIAKNLLGSTSDDVVAPVQASHLASKSTKREIAENLLRSMSEALSKLFELIQPLFAEYREEVSSGIASELEQSFSQKARKSSRVIASAVNQSSLQKDR